MEQYFYDDLRTGYPFIQWAAFHDTVYGKERALIREYKKLAKLGKLEESCQVWKSLRDVSDFVEDQTVWHIVQTASYASAFALLKPWDDAIGLNGGYMLPPVDDVSAQRREWLVDNLKQLGVSEHRLCCRAIKAPVAPALESSARLLIFLCIVDSTEIRP